MNIIYGKNTVESVILKDIKQIKKLYIQKGSAFSPRVYSIIKENNIPWESIEKEKINNLVKAKVSHQGIIAEVKDFVYSQLKDIIVNDLEKHTILMIDRIQDPQNFGSIIRSATMFGVDGIIIQEHNQVGVTPGVFKVAAGTLYSTPIVMVSNLTNAINELRQRGYWIYASSIDEDAQDVKEVDFDKKVVLVVGNEGEGVMKKIINHSDVKISIATTKTIDSLNVSVAAGILLYEVYNR